MSAAAPPAPERLGDGRGIAGEIETTGIEPIPRAERTMTPGRMFNVWIMSSASPVTPLIGLLLYPYGVGYAIGAIVATLVLFAVPTGILSEMGRELPLTIMVLARRIFGWLGSLSFSVVFTMINLGFFGLNCVTGALILRALLGGGVGLWDWVVGGVDIVLVLFGMKWLERFYRYTAWLLVASYAALFVYLCTHFTVHAVHQTQSMQWGSAITLVASFSIVGWMYDMSTVSRFAVPRGAEDRRQRRGYFWLPPIGIMIPVLVMGVLGMYSQRATGTWDLAAAPHISGWGTAAAIGVIVAILHTNAMNLYPSTMDILVVAKNLQSRTHRWEQPAVTVVFGILGIVLAEVGILGHVETFLDDIGDFIAPFCFVVIADWLWGLRDRDDVASYFARPRGWLDPAQWRWPAVLATVIGFAVSFWGHDLFGNGFVADVPMLFVGGLLSFALYGGWLSVRRGHAGSIA